MKTRVHKHTESETIVWTNGTGTAVVSGEIVKVGPRYGIAAVDIADGETGAVVMRGRFTIGKASALVLAQGQAVGADLGDQEAIADCSGGVLGEVTLAAGDGANEVEIELVGPARRSFGIAHSVTAAENTANQADIDTGFGAAPTGPVHVHIESATNVRRLPAGAVTYLAGADAGKIRIVDAGLAENEVIHLYAEA